MADKFACTVVSLVPFDFEESKPGLIPGTFKFKASDGKIPQCIVVYDARHNVYLDETRGSLGIRDAADEIARSIVEDFQSSQLGTSDGVAPGLFWVLGAYTADEIIKKFPAELNAAKISQNRWFVEICKIADNDWNRYHQHNVISDFQRRAAELLGYTKEEHEWMAPSLILNATRCPGCNTAVTKDIVICPTCRRILNKEKYNPTDYALVN